MRRLIKADLPNFKDWLKASPVNNASSIGNQSAKFQLNLSTQTIVTAAFVRSPLDKQEI